jgi:hypothetical protein
MIQICSSNGKNSTFIWQDDLKIALERNVTCPAFDTMTLVLSTALLYWLSALESEKKNKQKQTKMGIYDITKTTKQW